MNKLKVLYYMHSFGNAPFIQRQIHDISNKIEVHVLCNQLSLNPFLENTIDLNKVTVVSYPEPKWFFKIRQRLEFSDLLFYYYNPFFSKRIKRAIKKINPDIIHCQFGYDALTLYDNYYEKGKKIVVTFRGYDASLKLILKVYRKKLGRFLSKENVYPLFVSENLRSNLLKHHIHLNPINKILHSNIDTSFFSRKSYDIPRAKLIFTQVSNFREKKGHLYTVQAFEHFANNHSEIDFNIIFVGTIDNDCQNLTQQIKDSPIFSRITFTGHLSEIGIRDVLEKSHFFVHNSITSKFNDQEGIPNSIMEAMAMELPIITTRHSGIVELDDSNVDIYYSREKNIADYVKSIESAVNFGKYSSRNRQRIITSFSKDRFVLELNAYYESLYPESE